MVMASDGPRALLATIGSRRTRLTWLAGRSVARDIPSWPITAMFLGIPVWWTTGLGDLVLPMLAAVMVFLLFRAGRVQVPRGFGIWLLFLLWMTFSVIEIDSGGRLIGFVYRALMYLAVTVLFLYVYNGRGHVTARYLAGVLTGYWALIVVGGYLGIFAPLFSITTPLAHLLPGSVLDNELVQEIVTRRATQFDPTSYTALEPRPSAPFLYTNGWGNAYSLLMPVVVAYLGMVRRQRRFWWILLAIPVSLVPALLTLNRGMFLGLGVAALYVLFRLAVQRKVKAVAALLALLTLIALVYPAVSAGDKLSERLETSATTEVRLGLYQETLDRVVESPLFGFGAPRPSTTDGAPSVGTQGQVWMVLFSHGIPGLVFYLGWLIWAFIRTRSHSGGLGLAFNTVLLVTIVEGFYYGVLTSGLPLAMIAAGYCMRPRAEEGATSWQNSTRQ